MARRPNAAVSVLSTLQSCPIQVAQSIDADPGEWESSVTIVLTGAKLVNGAVGISSCRTRQFIDGATAGAGTVASSADLSGAIQIALSIDGKLVIGGPVAAVVRIEAVKTRFRPR